MSRETISLVIPMRNEGARVAVTLDSVLAGTRLPDEIVIADGCSTDDTVARCLRYAERGIKLRVVDNPAVFSGGGRNAGVAASTGSVIVLADCGNTVASDWLAEMVKPFEMEPHTEVVCGVFAPLVASDFEHCYAAIQHYHNYRIDEYDKAELEAILPSVVLPGGGTIALRRAVFDRIGGYPDWLHRAQDKLFSRKAYALGIRVTVSWRARIHHHMRSTPWQAAKICFQYGRGNGRSRFLSRHAVKLLGIYGAIGMGGVVATGVPMVALPTFVFAAYYTYRAGLRKALSLARGRSRRRLALFAPLALWARDLGSIAGNLVGWCDWLREREWRERFWAYMGEAPRARILFLDS